MTKSDPRPWWRGVPFPRHWRAYLAVKLMVLALALVVALRLLGVI